MYCQYLFGKLTLIFYFGIEMVGIAVKNKKIALQNGCSIQSPLQRRADWIYFLSVNSLLVFF